MTSEASLIQFSGESLIIEMSQYFRIWHIAIANLICQIVCKRTLWNEEYFTNEEE